MGKEYKPNDCRNRLDNTLLTNHWSSGSRKLCRSFCFLTSAVIGGNQHLALCICCDFCTEKPKRGRTKESLDERDNADFLSQGQEHSGGAKCWPWSPGITTHIASLFTACGAMQTGLSANAEPLTQKVALILWLISECRLQRNLGMTQLDKAEAKFRLT